MVKTRILAGAMLAALLAGCASSPDTTVQQNALAVQESSKNKAAKTQGLKRTVAIAQFNNESAYARGVFYDRENDPVGRQARVLLRERLIKTGKFILYDTDVVDSLIDSSKYLKQGADSTFNQDGIANKIDAEFLILGTITNFGRKNVGSTTVVSSSKQQVVEAGVSLTLVEAATAELVASAEGSGEAKVTSSKVMGLGGSAGYDETLDDKAISAAIDNLIEDIINNMMDKPWKSFFISYDDDGIIISGGKEMGIQKGNEFAVYQRGNRKKNPATGQMIELPGREVGRVRVVQTVGDKDTYKNQMSVVEFISGSIDSSNLSKYDIREIE